MANKEVGIWGPSGRDGGWEGGRQRREEGGGAESTLIPEDS